MIAPGMMPAIDGAVLRRDGGDVLRGLGAARARHVLDHDVRLAGNVAAEMARHRARVDVVAAAGRRADDQVDGLAGVARRRRASGAAASSAAASARRKRAKPDRRLCGIGDLPRQFSGLEKARSSAGGGQCGATAAVGMPYCLDNACLWLAIRSALTADARSRTEVAIRLRAMRGIMRFRLTHLCLGIVAACVLARARRACLHVREQGRGRRNTACPSSTSRSRRKNFRKDGAGLDVERQERLSTRRSARHAAVRRAAGRCVQLRLGVASGLGPRGRRAASRRMFDRRLAPPTSLEFERRAAERALTPPSPSPAI